MTWCSEVRRHYRLFVPAFALVLSLAALGAAQTVQAARASSASNRIDLRPNIGPVGTQVDVSLTLFTVPRGQQLRLTAGRAGATSGCLESTTIPGVAPFDPPQALPATMNLQVTWPATLAHGQYVICALSTGDNTVVAGSNEPFTVDDGSLTPTPQPVAVAFISSGRTTGLDPGTMVTLHVSQWFSADGSPPTQARVMPEGSGGTAALAVTVTAHPAPGEYDIQLTLPGDARPGVYDIVLSGGSLGQVIVPTSITVGGPVTLDRAGPPPRGDRPAAPGALVIDGVVALFLAVAVALLVPRRRTKKAA